MDHSADMATTPPLDEIDHALLAELEQQLPLDHRPFERLGRKLDLPEQECLRRVERLKERQAIREIRAHFDPTLLGYQTTLVAMCLPARRLQEAAALLGRHPGVAFVCERNDPFNLWWSLALPPYESLDQAINALHAATNSQDTVVLPALRIYKRPPDSLIQRSAHPEEELEEFAGEAGRTTASPSWSAQDVAFIRVLQEDLPLIEMPFAVLAEQSGAHEDALFEWMKQAQHRGILRRFAAGVPPRDTPAASTLVVWQVPAERVDGVAEAMSSVRAVVRCQRHPVYASWPYSLSTVMHAGGTAECAQVIRGIEERIGRLAHKTLITIKEYGRKRLRYFSPELAHWWQQVEQAGPGAE